MPSLFQRLFLLRRKDNRHSRAEFQQAIARSFQPRKTRFESLENRYVMTGDGPLNLTILNVPVAQAEAYSTSEDISIVTTAVDGVLANDTDGDSDPLTAVLVTPPLHGTLDLHEDGSFTYTPTANYNGSDSFEYKANDGSSDSNTVAVTLTINAVNDAPVAVADSYTVAEDNTLTVNIAESVLTNDTDTEGSTLTAILVTQPSHGVLNFNADGTFTYTPTANYNGPDSFTYRANDGEADSNVVAVSITVTPVNDAPVAVAG